MSRAALAILAVSLVLIGCGQPADREPGAASNVIGEPLEQSLDKARSVEDLSGVRKGDLDSAIEDAD